MKNINILSLAKSLGFDVKCSNINDKIIASNMIINEKYDVIPPFNSNKIIFYSNNLSKEEINSTLEQQICTYLKYKSQNKLQLVEQDTINNKDRLHLDDNEVISILLNKKIIKNKNKVKTLYHIN